jgi:hypothetical protein
VKLDTFLIAHNNQPLMTEGSSHGTTIPQKQNQSKPRRGRIHFSDQSSTLVPTACVLLLAALIMLPVFIRGFPAGFDAVRHYRWTAQFIDAIRDGALYPRWLPTANNGLGSPVPLYYPPLPFYVSAAFAVVMKDTLFGIELSCWLALALSGLGMFVLARPMMTANASFVAAAIYMAAPYHLLDLYQGATVSEFWSLAWIPFLLDALRRVVAAPKPRATGYLAIVYSMLLLTHVPVSFLVTLTLPVFALLLTRDLWALTRVALALGLGAGIAAIFVVPVIFETRYVGLFFKFDYRDYFLFEHLRVALTSTRFPKDSSLSSYLLDTELVAFATLALFGVSSVILWLTDREVLKWSATQKAVWLVTCGSFLMSTRLTAPIWKMVPGLSFLFYPWRWLVVATAGTAFFAASCTRMIQRYPSWRSLNITALALVIVFSLSVSALMVWRAPYDRAALEGGLGRRDAREYRPVWWDGQVREESWQSPAHIESGSCEVQAIDDVGIKQNYLVSAKAESVVTIRPLYFPGWIARVDGAKVQVAPSAEGNIQLTIEPGEHSVALSFEDTWPRTLGKLVSALSFACFVFLFMRPKNTPG